MAIEVSYPWLHLIDQAWPRFVGYVDARDPCGCWLWLGGLSRGHGKSDNYGSFYVGERFSVRAHIFSAVAAGDEEPGNHRDHLCRQTLCVNPLHLEHVTPQVNNERLWSHRRAVGWSPLVIMDKPLYLPAGIVHSPGES